MTEAPSQGGDTGPDEGEKGAGDEFEAEVDEIGDESFPASDAPQWWSGPPEERT